MFGLITYVSKNNGDETVQLLRRHWHITDFKRKGSRSPWRRRSWGKASFWKPGETYEYTSGTPLSTPSGFMVGSYQMVNGDGKHFSVSVPAFSLDSPHEIGLLN